MTMLSANQLSEAQQQNWEVALEASRRAREDSNSPHAGKYLGIAERRVVVIADSWDELHARLNELDYDRHQSVGIEASADYERPVMLWSPQLGAATSNETSADC